MTAVSDETGRGWLPLKYEDGPDFCTVTFATGAAFALTVHPERMKLMEAALSASPVVEPKPVTDLVDDLAKWLHDETAHPESYPDHTWPETDRDDGRRSGGWVKIVPLHAQEYFRDIARRLDARYRSRYVAPVAQEPVAVNKLVNAILNELFRASDNAVIAHNTVYELKPYIERAILSTLPRASLTK